MAVCYISEYPSGGFLGSFGVSGNVQEPEITTQTVAIGVGSAQSAAFNQNTRYIRVHTDAICSILIGSNPTALVTSKRLAANQTEYFTVSPGHKLAVIANT